LHVVATRSSRFCAGRDPPTTLTCVPFRDGHLAALTVAGFAREPARSFPASFPLASGLNPAAGDQARPVTPRFYTRTYCERRTNSVHCPRCCSLLVFRITVIRSGSNGYGCATSR
jgi:hypothetical protein